MMKIDKFKERIVDPQFKECHEILIDRSSAYASEEDFLANFKREAIRKNALGFQFNGKPVKPEHIALWAADTKLDRWANRLKRGKDPSDDYTDLINYTLLGKGLHIEEDVDV